MKKAIVIATCFMALLTLSAFAEYRDVAGSTPTDNIHYSVLEE
jgi:hypothetical protein